ncbi:MAG: lysophospholipase [Leptospirales bacterium]|nr:lysophospholipase [Leptospirales bacterium]
MNAGAVREVRGRFRTVDGLALEWRAWMLRNAPIWRSLVIHHGLGEHCGRYETVLEAARESQCNVFSFDARGHGLSPGPRGDAPALQALVDDLDNFLQFLNDELGLRRPVLLGHSMGGLIAAAFALSRSNQWHLQRLCLSAPAFRPHLSTIQRLKENVARALYLLRPDLALASGLPTEGISRDRLQVARYRGDALVHDRISVRLALGLIDGGRAALASAPRLRIPCLVQHGEADPITDSSASRLFYEQISSEHRRLCLYPEGRHESFHELPDVRDRALNDLCDWLEEAWQDRALEEGVRSQPEGEPALAGLTGAAPEAGN